ncbi:RNA polymerase sigma factor [Pseudomonas sp. ABC1]|nr:RNA polymerase sigma factor [Pseudomonas sp. ABC1]
MPLERIYLKHRQLLLQTLQRLVGNRAIAEELAQEAYIRVLQAMRERRVEFVESFLYQTARNLALDHLRSVRRKSRVLVDDVSEVSLKEVPANDPELSDVLARRQLIAKLQKALEQLTERQREIFILSRAQGWRYQEIADHLGVSPSTVQKELKLASAICVAILAREKTTRSTR